MENILWVSDLHIPFEDKKSVRKLFDDLKNNEYDTVVLGGDTIDMESPSKFEKRPDQIGTLQQELDKYYEFMDKLKEYHKGKLIYLVGNHESVSKDTEVLTKEGWKNVRDVSKDTFVAQFDQTTGEIEYHKPLSLVRHYSEKLVEIESRNTKQKVTLNHDVVINGEKHKAKNLVGKRINQNDFFLSGNFSQKTNELSLNELELLTWVIMDGCMVNRDGKIHHVQFKLSKKRKLFTVLLR